MREYVKKDVNGKHIYFKTSPSPFYPFGGDRGMEGQNYVRLYFLYHSIYFEDYKPNFGIYTCFHTFSTAEDALRGERLNMTLKKLDDSILEEWF